MPSIESGSGSFLELDTKDNEDKYIYIYELIPILIPFSMCFICCFYLLIYLKIKDCIWKKIKYFKARKEQKKDTKVDHNGLSSNYIKELNKHNFTLETELECSICIDTINLEEKKSKQNVIFLNCGHPFHKNCLQSWVKTNINQGTCISCPMCRRQIIKNSYSKVDYSSDSDAYSLSDEF